MNARALALVLAAAALGACTVDDMSSVEISGVCTPPDDPTTCTFDGECGEDEQFIGVMTLDTRVSGQLHLITQINNQLVDNRDEGTFQANSHDAYVTEMEVEYEATFPVPGWSQPIGPYIVPADTAMPISVFPVDVATPDALAAFLALDAAAVASGSVRVVANVRLRGVYQDQGAFETAEWPVAIDVCDGCLFGGLTRADVTDPTFDCDLATTGIQSFIWCPNLGQIPSSVDCVD
jgi:hypothetical protein